MAEDCNFGFKFKDFDRDITKDADVKLAAETMFSEVSFDHFGGRADVEKASVRDAGAPNDFESVEFTEGFDFTF